MSDTEHTVIYNFKEKIARVSGVGAIKSGSGPDSFIFNNMNISISVFQFVQRLDTL